jgi:hypothetical protein
MSSLVTRKKSEMTAKVQRLQERHDTLAAALDASGDLGQQSAVVVTEADWKAKYEMVRSQLPAYRFMKAELTELESEVGSRLPQVALLGFQTRWHTVWQCSTL